MSLAARWIVELADSRKGQPLQTALAADFYHTFHGNIAFVELPTEIKIFFRSF